MRPGRAGELVHRGPTVAMGYWGNEEATRKAYRPNPLAPPELLDVERVVYSGERSSATRKGSCTYLGRKDAMIKSQGYRLSPEEVENLLHRLGPRARGVRLRRGGPGRRASTSWRWSR